MADRFDTYLRALRQAPLGEHTEMTGRSALEQLLNAFAADASSGKISVQHEPKHVADKGAPDFKVYRTIFPQLTLWLPDDEGAQFRLEFETEMARFDVV